MKLIIVDDNKTFLESLQFYVENILNHQVIATASNGKEFLELNKHHAADIILMDIEMPHIDGFKTIKITQQDLFAIKVIAITSYTDRAYLNDLIEAGFKACIPKSEVYKYLEKAIEAVTSDRYFYPTKMKIKK